MTVLTNRSTIPMSVEFRPAFAPHVLGRYTVRVPDGDGGFEKQFWLATCEKCGIVYGVATCVSGQVELKISMFAKGHLWCGREKR